MERSHCQWKNELAGKQKTALKLFVMLFRGLGHLLGKQSTCDLLLTEHVICNPYALEHDEEKRLKGHEKYSNGEFSAICPAGNP